MKNQPFHSTVGCPEGDSSVSMATSKSTSSIPPWGWQHSRPLLHLQTSREQVLARQRRGKALMVCVCVMNVCVCVWVGMYMHMHVWAEHIMYECTCECVCACTRMPVCVRMSMGMPMYWCNTSISNIPQWPDHAVCILLRHIVEGDHRKGRPTRVLDGRAKLV